jgi:hypothetical protein
VDLASTLVQGLVPSLLSGTVVAALLTVFLRRRTEQVAAEVKQHFDNAMFERRSEMDLYDRMLSELFGPVVMQFDRTSRAFKRWQAKNVYVEAKIIFEGNRVIRDTLLSKGHLIPPDLQEDAGRLVEHYDRWFEEFERVRGGAAPALDEAFVFVGPAGYPFPSGAEQRFKARFHEILKRRYPVNGAVGDRA